MQRSRLQERTTLCLHSISPQNLRIGTDVYKKGLEISGRADVNLVLEIASGRLEIPKDIKPGTDFDKAITDAKTGIAPADLACGPYRAEYTHICNTIG